MDPYQYTKLSVENEEIRLLTLLPGEFDDPLQVTISHVSLRIPEEKPSSLISFNELEKTLPSRWILFQTLPGRYIFAEKKSGRTSWSHPKKNFNHSYYQGYPNDPDPTYEPKFEALSYVWGSPEKPASIYVQTPGAETSTPLSESEILKITENLDSAMRHLRLSDKPRTLWIDAVCINQNDVAERNVQVKRMQYIFKLAHRTIFWLGPSVCDSLDALNALKALSDQVELTRSSHFIPRPDCNSERWHQLDRMPPFDPATWSAINDLYQRAWFKRHWIILEVQMSSRYSYLQCGHDKLLWTKMRRATWALLLKPKLPIEVQKDNLNYARSIISRYDSIGDTFSIFASATRRECTDPRDRIYSLLCLTESSFSKRIQVDYSITYKELCKETFLALNSSTQSLDTLTYAGRNGAFPEFPSWLPTWTSASDSDYFLFVNNKANPQAELIASNEYKVTGVIIDTIKSVSEELKGDKDSISRILRHEWKLVSTKESYMNRLPVLDGFIAAVTKSENKELYPEFFTHLTIAEWRREFHHMLVENGRSWQISRLFDSKDSSYFFVTESGYFGLGAAAPQIGDVAVQILNCRALLLFRPVGKTFDTFQVIGQCFVAGFEFGEALLGRLPRHYRVEMLNSPEGYTESRFRNRITKSVTSRDPRLGRLPRDWEIHHTHSNGSICYQNQITGEMSIWDPRFSSEELKSRGIKIEAFTLV